MYLTIYLSIYLSIHPSIHLSIYLLILSINQPLSNVTFRIWYNSLSSDVENKNDFLRSIFLAGVEPSPLPAWPFRGLLYQPWMIDDDDDDYGATGGVNAWYGTCSSAALAIPEPTHDLILS
jgi:hypothetical protein